MDAYIFIGITLALILFGMPISFALGFASLSYMFIEGIPVVTFIQQLSRGINSFTLLALPFFILAGQLMNQGGITSKIFSAANSLVGHIRGGLAQASILATMVFSSISGSAVAVAGALGVVQIDAMKKNGYDARFATGLVASATTIGPVIPPSVVMVVYGIAAGVSIGDLFIGAIIPGLLMGVVLMAYVGWKSRRENFPRYHDSFSLKKLLASSKDAIVAMFAPLIIIGGIMGGVFTATEAGAVACVYSALVGFFYYRELTLAKLWAAIVDTMNLSATILLIMGMSSAFSFVLAFERIPALLANLLLSISPSPEVILLILMAFYLILGLFIEAIAIIAMTIPVVLPVIHKLGIDPVHFGVLLAINMSLGTITPPLGIVLYVMSRVSNLSVMAVAWATIVPFMLFVCLMLVVAFVPALVTWLPNYLR